MNNNNTSKIVLVIVAIIFLCICCVVTISVLISASLIAIDPASNFADSRNAQRSTDVTQILNAVTQYTSSYGNELSDLGNIPNCNKGSEFIGFKSGNIDLGRYLVDEYLVEIPEDPLEGNTLNTGYTICVENSGKVVVSAPFAEDGEIIKVSR